MCPYSVTVLIIITALTEASTTVSKKGCGIAAIGTKHSVLHISPAIVKGTALRKIVRLRDEIPDAPQDGGDQIHLANVNNLAELIVKRSSGGDVDCRNAIQHPANVSDVPTKVVNETGVDGENVNKKKTVIGSDVDLRTFANVAARIDTAMPQKRLLSISKSAKKTFNGKNSISSLIAAMKSKALSSFLGNLNSNTKTGVKKSSPVTTVTTTVVTSESPKKKLENFLAVNADVPQSKTDNAQQKSTPSKNDTGHSDTGKSILAAIDDKEGLRAALAKAIDRVEKVVANKNGALATANKPEHEKQEEAKVGLDSRSPDVKIAALKSDFETKVTNDSNISEAKVTGDSKSSEARIAGDPSSSEAKVTGDSKSSDAKVTEPKGELRIFETKVTADSFQAKVTGDSKGSVENIAGDSKTVNSTSTEAKNATVNNLPVENASLFNSTTANAIKSVEKPVEKPVAKPVVVNDPYAEIAMGPDKPKIPELKGEDERAISPSGVVKMGEGTQAAAGGGGGGGAGASGAGGAVSKEPLAGMHDVGGLLDSLTDKVNLADTKGGLGGAGAGLSDSASSLLDRAQDKFNQMSGDISADGTPVNNNEVKYMQSQLPDGSDGSESSPNKILEKGQSAVDNLKPVMDQIKPMGGDEAMKALAGGNTGTGDEMSPNNQVGTNNEANKPMEKDEMLNNMMKQQSMDTEDDGAMKGMGQMKEDSQMKEGGDGGDDMSHEMHKTEDDAPMIHKDTESSENLVKDILDKAGSISMGGKNSGDDTLNTLKDLQGADISPGPDPYENDKQADSYGMYGGGGGGGGGMNKNDGDSYGDMPNARDMGGAVQNYPPHSNSDESYGDNYDKGGGDYDSPRENIETNDEQQMPARARGGGGMDSYLNMAAMNTLGNENGFTTRQVIPEHAWRNQRARNTGTAMADSSFHDNYNAQIFKKHVIMRPERDYYVSPFHDKNSFDVDQ